MAETKVIREVMQLINSSFPRVYGAENSSKSVPAFMGDNFNGYDKLVGAFVNEFQKGESARDSVMIEALKQMLDKHKKATENIESAIKLLESNGKKK
jgi:hypothetical protein